MAKIKVSEVQGAVLDYLVAVCEGYTDWCGETEKFLAPCKEYGWVPLCDLNYSTDPSKGIPILEQEGINLRAIRKEGHPLNGQWLAAYDHGNTSTTVQWVKRLDWPCHFLAGPTLLVAGLRCYVVRSMGEEVEVPNELLET